MRDFEIKYKDELIETVPMLDQQTLTKEQVDEKWLERSNTLVKVTTRANNIEILPELLL